MLLTPITNEQFRLLAQLFINDTDLHIENSGRESNRKMINWAQTILNTWYQALRLTGRELKLDKCYWIMQSYVWKDNKITLVRENSEQLILSFNDEERIIPYVPTYISYTLVGISTNLANDNASIYILFQDKLNQYIATV